MDEIVDGSARMDVNVLSFAAGQKARPAVSVIECFETDGGVNYRSDRLILF